MKNLFNSNSTVDLNKLFNSTKNCFDYDWLKFPSYPNTSPTLFPQLNPSWTTPVDNKTYVNETDKEQLIIVIAAGYEKENIKVTVEKGNVIIKGEQKFDLNVNFLSNLSSLFYTFALAKDADVENIDAEIKNGILIIRIPKFQKEIKRITVK